MLVACGDSPRAMALAPSLKSLLDRPAEARRLGPFYFLRQLGRGSFAPVWLAREVYGDVEIRLAAVKLFAFEVLAQPDQRRNPLRAACPAIVKACRTIWMLDPCGF